MMKSTPLIRVFAKGGLISPADLLRIMEASEKAGNSYIMFGSRQDILFPVADTDDEEVRPHLKETGLEYQLTDSMKLKEPFQYENIVSSYVGVNIMDTTWWLKEDLFHYILDSFDYQPVLKVNIIDPIQSLVPLFTGHLNFIASKEEHYWHLFIRQPTEGSNDNPEPWPDLIHENDIAPAAKQIENVWLESPEINNRDLYKEIQKQVRIHSKKSGEKLSMPTAFFPYYEGLNAMQNHFYWLGLYWRNNRFDIDFLSAACRLCQDTRVGKISITPWKSFIIKGIRSDDRILWEKLMGRFGINLRHSSLELNWHLPVMDEKALQLKTYLVRELDQQDISTHGLTFTIKHAPDMLLFTSVVIEQCRDMTNRDGESLYNILYAREFNPNHSEYCVFAKEMEKERLPGLLIKLSKFYFRQLEIGKSEEYKSIGGEEKKASFQNVSSYQCSNCLTVYDKKFGDPESGFQAGTPFGKLPEDYTCPVCTNPKEYFVPLVD